MAQNTPPPESSNPDGEKPEVRVTGLIQRTIEFKRKYEVLEAFPEETPPPPPPEEANAHFEFKIMTPPSEPPPKRPRTLSDM